MKEKYATMPLNDMITTKYQLRLALNEEVVEHYAEVMAGGWGNFPPIDVAEISGKYYVVDGHHRWAAAERAGICDVPFQIVAATENEAWMESYKRNATQGLCFTRADRQNAIRVFCEQLPNASNGFIAALIGCDPETVRRHRPTPANAEVENQTEKRIGADGKARGPRKMPAKEYDAEEGSEYCDAKEESRYDSEEYDAKVCSQWEPDSDGSDSDFIETADEDHGFVEDDEPETDSAENVPDKAKNAPPSTNVTTSRKIMELFGQLDRDFVIATLARLNDLYGYLLP